MNKEELIEEINEKNTRLKKLNKQHKETFSNMEPCGLPYTDFNDFEAIDKSHFIKMANEWYKEQWRKKIEVVENKINQHEQSLKKLL